MSYSPGVETYIQRGKEMEAARQAHRSRMRGKKFDTILVHGMYDMQEAMSNHGSIIEPAYFSTSEHFENSDHLEAGLAYLTPAWTYARFGNPTVYYLEETIALLEGYGYDGDVSALTVASGNAAIFLTAHLLLPQDGKPLNFVATARCYGGTFMIFSKRFAEERGVEVRWVKNPLDVNEWASKIDENTRFLYGEMPSNPSLSVMPVAEIAALAHQHDIPFVVDSTVATPALMRPLQHGADIVVQSVTKSMATSGMVIAGAIIARHDMPNKFGTDDMRHDFITYARKPFRDLGPGLSAMSALLALNDLRTLRHRMDYISRSTMRVAEFLHQHPRVDAVYYPGLETDEGHSVAKKYMKLVDSEDDYGEVVNRYGHLISFTVKGDTQAVRDVFDRFEMIWRATDLGRIKSVATIPAISTHQQQGEVGRDLASIPANLIRLNVGGEHPADIIADLEQALRG